MKKLICADDVKEAAQKGQKVLYIDSCTIITPSAKDLAKELSMEFTGGSTSAEKKRDQENNPQKDAQQGIAMYRDVIYQVVKEVLANRLPVNVSGQASETPFLTEGDPGSGPNIVRGRTVEFEPFKSSFSWELCNEVMSIVLEGSLSLALNAKTYEASQGDVIFLPKGSKVTWCSSGYAKLFYVIYPANWSELMAQKGVKQCRLLE